MQKIDFKNEINNRLQFYEKKVKGKLVEYAYIKEDSPDITFHTEEGDIKKWPKAQLPSFIINLYNNIAKEKLSERIDLKSKSSKPRFGLRIQGRNINLIHYLISTMGLLTTLDYLKIRYQFGEKKAPGAFLNMKIIDTTENYLSIFCTSLSEEYMINGLLDGLKLIQPVEKKNLNSKELWHPFLKIKGESFARNLHELDKNFIDQTTQKILKMYNIPTTMREVLSKYIPDMLLNAATEDITELSSQRIRMSEAISHSAYKVFGEALGRIRNIKHSGKDFELKLMLDPLAIVKKIQASGMLQPSQTTNPMEELNFSSKITKTGVGNMLASQVTLKRRDLNPSYYGVISPVSTNEYGNVGLTQTLTNKATISNRFGSIQTREFSDDINPFDTLSASESLQTFYEYDDTTRRVMGNQQFGQFVQLDNPDEPLVQTSFEEIIPHLVSDRFAIKSKKDGRVKEIKDGFIIVHNKDGSMNKYNANDTKSRTKRGIYIPMKYTVLAKAGQRVHKGQLLATTSSLRTGKLAAGRNLVVAQMSYRGMNYEDGWVITEPVKDKYDQKVLDKITIIVPADAKITKFNVVEGMESSPGDILVSYAGSEGDIETYADENPENELADDVLSGVEYRGNETLYRSSGGKVVDVVIKLNSRNVDSQIYKAWKKGADKVQSQKKECQLLKSDHVAYVDCISDIQNPEIIRIGGHKVNATEFDGAVIEVYIEKPNSVSNGSKFTLGATGGKGTVQYIIPEGKEPKTEKTKLKIEFFPTPLSIVSRKNISILLLMYTGKVVYFLNKRIQELARADKLKEARELLLETYTHMDASTDQFLVNEIMGFFDAKSAQEAKKYILGSDPLQSPAFPMLVPPHRNKITMENIQKAAATLGVPLNEKVYVPEEDAWTEREVPVGIMPVIYLEHFPKAMSGARGSLSVGRQTTTGQGRSGTRVGAGATKLGLYDLFAISYKEPGLLMKEMHGLHSDNKEARSRFQKEVLKTGKMPDVFDLKVNAQDSKTKQLVETFFKGAMLDINL